MMNISLNNVGKKYDAWIFRGVNFEYAESGIYAIIGKNGSGKSTLLQIISGFISPTEGGVKYSDSGQDLNIEDLPTHISFSAPYLDLPDEFSVLEIVEMHQQFKPFFPSISSAMILEKTQLIAHQNKLLSKLSSGMKQRLKLALAIYSNSALLLLDEPCANLDAQWTQWFNEELIAHAENRLVIVCSNSMETELRAVNRAILDVSLFNL